MTDKTLGGYIRTTPHQNDMDGGVAAEQVEQGADTRTREHLLHEESRLLKLEESLRAHLSRTINRAERAERERDEWKDSAIKAMADLERAEHPRPLTSDAITPAMIGRAYDALVAETGWVSRSRVEALDVLRRLLTAALTEPPARPEGAEEIEALLTGSYAEPRYVADFLAERGVRVTGAES